MRSHSEIDGTRTWAYKPGVEEVNLTHNGDLSQPSASIKMRFKPLYVTRKASGNKSDGGRVDLSSPPIGPIHLWLRHLSGVTLIHVVPGADHQGHTPAVEEPSAEARPPSVRVCPQSHTRHPLPSDRQGRSQRPHLGAQRPSRAPEFFTSSQFLKLNAWLTE